MAEHSDMKDKDLLKEFGNRVREFRKQKGWTLEDLASASGLHPSSISQVERGERNLTLNNLQRLSEGLKVEPFQLLLFEVDHILKPEEAVQFKVKEMLENAPDAKKELLYHLSRVLLEWDPEDHPK